jgi:hypothetical protein
MKGQRSIVALIAMAVFLVAAGVAQASVIYGNIGSLAQSTNNTAGFMNGDQPNQFQAQGFTVGSNAGSLNTIVLGLSANLTSPNSLLELYSNNAGSPGSLLETFTLTNGPVLTKQTYTFNGSYLMSANTSYWVVLSVANADSSNSIYWYAASSFLNPSGQNGSGLTYLGTKERNDVGGTWTTTLPSMSINLDGTMTNTVPEPSTYVLLGIALGVVGFARRRMSKQS